MLDPTFASQVAGFQKAKAKQFKAIMKEAKLPGLQFSMTDRNTTFILRYSVEGFEDQVVFGRAPRQQIRAVALKPVPGRLQQAVSVAVPEHEKMATKKKIDLSTSDIQAVIEGWKKGQRAAKTLEKLAEKRGQVER